MKLLSRSTLEVVERAIELNISIISNLVEDMSWGKGAILAEKRLEFNQRMARIRKDIRDIFFLVHDINDTPEPKRENGPI